AAAASVTGTSEERTTSATNSTSTSSSRPREDWTSSSLATLLGRARTTGQSSGEPSQPSQPSQPGGLPPRTPTGTSTSSSTQASDIRPNPATQRTIPQGDTTSTSESALSRQEADSVIISAAVGISTQDPGQEEDVNPVATPSEMPSTTQSSSNPTGRNATSGGETIPITPTVPITPTSPTQTNPSDPGPGIDPKLRAAEDVTEEELKKIPRETIVNLLQSRGTVNSRAHKATLDSELLAQHKVRAFNQGDVAVAEAEVLANKRSKRVRPSRRTGQDATRDTANKT
ncbi:hypothetical protein A4X13_0g8518, partial [Tilletia indica]